jgi:Na+/pantothenate symporter
MSDPLPSVTVVINGQPPDVADVLGDVTRLLVENLNGQALGMLQAAITDQVMPAIKSQLGAAVATVIADFQANGWPEVDRRGQLTGKKTTLSAIVTTWLLRTFGGPDALDPYPSPDSAAVEPAPSTTGAAT